MMCVSKPVRWCMLCHNPSLVCPIRIQKAKQRDGKVITIPNIQIVISPADAPGIQIIKLIIEI